MIVTVKSRSKSLKDTELPSDVTSIPIALDIISKANKNINPNRIKLTYLKENKQIPITSDNFLKELSNEELYVKDIGPQISWRLVFCVEYLGPMLVHSFVYWLSKQESLMKYHSSNTHYNPLLNKLAYTLIMGHFAKRELESIFLHKFSQSTMPLFNLFKNSFHYWVLSGAISIGYFGYGFLISDAQLFKLYSYVKLNNLNLLLGLFVMCEFWNFYVHYKLRRWGDAQKAKGITKRVPLEDGLFKVFVAPNYTFEIFSWTWFTLIFKLNIFAVIFLVVSTVTLRAWSAKKNKRYGTKRAFLIPFVF